MPVDSKSSVKPITAIIEELKATFPQGVRVDLGQSGAGASAAIRGLRHDSRKVSSGDAFFCIEGQKYDGNLFVKDAVDKGASLVISEKAPPADADINVPFVVVPDVRQALAAVSDYFFDRPSKRMRLIGVTGTNGKTTTTHMVEHIFQSQGTRVGLIGTLGARWTHADAGRDYQDLKFTTPQASDLQELLNTMANDGVSHVAMEVSSHALALKRVEKCEFAVACLTNVSQDHLDFHKTMEHYWKSKRILFEQLTAGSQTERAAVINLDDALANDFLKAVGKDVRAITYGWNETADVRAVKADFDFTGTRLELATPYGALKLKLKLNGVFNVYNAMSALSIVLNEGVDKETAKEAIESFEGVAGRFEVVRLAQPEDGEIDEPLCLVDYAHTPDGLDNVLRAARKLVPAGGKLIVVFGCGGDRDASKRPQMGEIAESLADELVVTSDNPRSEDPQQIIAEILAGIKRLNTGSVRVEADRARAIDMAIDRADKNDVILVAGKGHETYQILADRTIHFDDREVVRQALSSRQAKRNHP